MNIHNLFRNIFRITCCTLYISSCSSEGGSGKTGAPQAGMPAHDDTASYETVTPAPRSFQCNGFILSAYNRHNSLYILIDTVEYYSGSEARRKIALEQKQNSKYASFEGYYLKNTRTDSIRVKLSDNAKITLQTFSHDSSGSYRFNEKTDAGRFYRLISSDEFRSSGFKIFSFGITDDKIISIKEIYIP